MSVLVWLSVACLVAAAALTVVRIVRGPTVLNRAVAADVLVSVLLCAVGLEAVVSRHTTTTSILISLSLVGFVGSVAVARFVARDRDPLPEEDGDVSAGDLPSDAEPGAGGERGEGR